MKQFKYFLAFAIAWMVGVFSASAYTGEPFTVTVDGVEMTFSVIHEVGDDQPATARVGTVESNPAINSNTEGVVTVPETVSREVGGTTYTYTVTSTGYSAFVNRTKITQVNLPATLKEINPSCFKGCTSLETVNFADGSQLTTINYSALENCSSLTALTLPSTVTTIDYNAFQGCSALTSIDIPAGVTTIGNQAFKNCSGLATINIPASLTTIGTNVFEGCTGLLNLYFNIDNYKPAVFTNLSDPVLTSEINENLRIHVSETVFLAFRHKLTSWYFYSGQETADNPCEYLVVDGMVQVGDKGLAVVEAVDKTTGAVGARYVARVVYISVDGERKAIFYGGSYTSTDNIDDNQCWHGYSLTEWGQRVCGSAFEKLSTPTAYSNMKLTFPSKVEDSHGNIYTVIGLGAFATWGCSFYGVEDVRIPKTYTHLGSSALCTLSSLQNYVVIPSSVKQISSPAKKAPSDLFAESSENTGDENRLKNVYFLHRDANITWHETSTNQYFRWKNYDNRYVYLNVCQAIADTYCSSDASWNGFKAWTNYVMTGSDKTSHQKRSTWDPRYVAYISGTQKHFETGEYSLIMSNNFKLPITIEHFSSTDNNIVEPLRLETASNGTLVLYYQVKSVGTANIVFHYPGDDVFDELESSVTVISKSETACGDQTLNNQYNTVAAPSAGVAKINLTEDDFIIDETYEKAAMTTAGGKLYVSLTSNEYYSSGDGLMLKSSPDLLTPNYGAAYRTAYVANGSDGVSDMQQGADYGGMLCFKVPSGKGTITIDGYLYDSSAILGVRVAGNAEMRLTSYNDEWTYEYEVEADSWAYIYGINLGDDYNYKAYIKSITIQPEGAPMPKVSILGQDIEDYANLDDLLGDGGSVKFNWGYPGETDVTAANAQAATLTLNNATLTNANGPAIEVNSLSSFIVFVEGENTVSGTGEASISMGTLNGIDWDGTMLYVVNEEGDASSLTIPNTAKNGIYSYDGAAGIYNITSADIAGTECGLIINNVNGSSGGYAPVSLPAKAPIKRVVSSYVIGQLAIQGVQSVEFRGGQAAVYGLSVAPESNSDSDCSIVEIDPEDAVFNSYLSSYVVIDESGSIKAPKKKIPSYPDVTYATKVVYGPQPPAITICGRGITKEDFLSSVDGTIALNAEGTAVLSWEELDYNGVSPKAPRKGKDDDNTLYDYGYPVLTLNGATLAYEGDGPAIEVNTYPLFFIRVEGTNSISATNASSVISVGTARGRNDNSSDYTPSVIILNDDEETGSVLPSLTLSNSKEGGDGIYVYRGSCDVQNCAVNITAPQYALHYYFDLNSSSGGDSPKAPRRNEKRRAPRKIAAPDGPIGYAGYLNIYEGSELTLNGGEAALWGSNYHYFENVGVVGSDLNAYKTQYTYYEGPEFTSVSFGDYITYGSYEMWVSSDNNNWEQKYAKSLQIAPNVIYGTTNEGVEMMFTIVNKSEKTVKVGDDNWSCAIDDSYSGPITIPATVNGYDVVGIGGDAFYGCGITSVTLPETEKFSSIDGYAFENSALQTVTIPDNVTRLGWDAFEGCSSLVSATLGEGITSLQSWTFYGCQNLETVYLPNGLKTIGNRDFYNCSSLSSIIIPNSVNNIGVQAFSGCNSLTEVTCNAVTPPSLEYNSFYNIGSNAVLYVPYGCYNKYNSDELYWKNFFTIRMIDDKMADIVTIEPEDEYVVVFGVDMTMEDDGETIALNLENAVAGGVYYNLVSNEDETNGVDTEEGCIVINTTTSEEDMANIVEDELRSEVMQEKFRGLIVEVNGKGTVKIDCKTVGSGKLAVRIGADGEATPYQQGERGEISVDFDVNEPTCIYIYASDMTVSNSVKGYRMEGVRRANDRGDGAPSVMIYQLKVEEYIPTYNIEISGTMVTGQNASDFTYYGLKSGSISFDPSTYTLTLNNVDMEEAHIVINGNAADEDVQHLTINLIGNNQMKTNECPFYVWRTEDKTHLDEYGMYPMVAYLDELKFTSTDGTGTLVTLMVDQENTIWDTNWDDDIDETEYAWEIAGLWSLDGVKALTFDHCQVISGEIGAESITVQNGAILATRYQIDSPVTCGEGISYRGFTEGLYVYGPNNFTITERVTIGRYGMATYCSPNALNFSEVEGLKAYIVSGFNPTSGNLVLTRVYDVVAGTGLVLYGNPGDYDIPVDPTTETNYEQMLVGCLEDKVIQPTTTVTVTEDGGPSETTVYTNFVMSVKGGQPGFYRFTVNEGTGRTIQAGKAYLRIRSSDLAQMPSSVKGFSIVFNDDEPTGIADMEGGIEKIENIEIYNLAGQRLNKMQKGINIVNGKKVLVK